MDSLFVPVVQFDFLTADSLVSTEQLCLTNPVVPEINKNKLLIF